MGRHPSRDEIASADYWGASVWVAGEKEGRQGGSRRLGLMAAPLLGEQGSERG